MDYTVHRILQTRKLEWVAVPFYKGFSQPRNRPQASFIAGRFFTIWATREAQAVLILFIMLYIISLVLLYLQLEVHTFWLPSSVFPSTSPLPLVTTDLIFFWVWFLLEKRWHGLHLAHRHILFWTHGLKIYMKVNLSIKIVHCKIMDYLLKSNNLAALDLQFSCIATISKKHRLLPSEDSFSPHSDTVPTNLLYRTGLSSYWSLSQYNVTREF